MEVAAAADECTSTVAAAAGPCPPAPLALNIGRQRSSSLDNHQRSWCPDSGFACKYQTELETKRLYRERQMQQIQGKKKKQQQREAELDQDGPARNGRGIVEADEWKTVVSHGRRARGTERRTTSESSTVFLSLTRDDPPALGSSRSLDGTVRPVAGTPGQSFSQDELEAADVMRRKRRQQMKRRPKTPSQRLQADIEPVEGVPHPSLLGKVMFARRSSLQRLADKMSVDNNAVVVQYGSRSSVIVERQSSCSRRAHHLPNGSTRKKTSVVATAARHQSCGKTFHHHDHNESVDSSPREVGQCAGNRPLGRSFSKSDSPRSPRSGSDSHGSPRPRKCGDKRDFFFRNLNYEVRSQLLVDEVAEFSVTDFDMATKISQAMLGLFAPPKDDITPESSDADHEECTFTAPEHTKYPLVVTDGTACIGGNVLSFCDYFTHVNAVENDLTRVQMLRHNLQVLNKTNATCMHANYLDVMLELQQDVVFLDPPWGGPEYKDLDEVDLFLGGLPLYEICTQLQASTKCVVLKVPSNFNDAKFTQHVPGTVVIRRDLKKMHLVLLDFR
uniref:Trimethylguanosine synthase n=1 Tax=Hyaloperonospora arabidopsidis (strain Emoy2) TaxID=559515 RepID=M4C3Z9_HYAAE